MQPCDAEATDRDHDFAESFADVSTITQALSRELRRQQIDANTQLPPTSRWARDYASDPFIKLSKQWKPLNWEGIVYFTKTYKYLYS